jgi:2-dehydro-3-deoxyphosphooctonate aldolase (KDO 8-P synthase)
VRAIGIIPARYEASRFPGKVLANVMGKPLIQYVYEEALKSSALEDLVVACDDERILKAVEGFAGRAVMTAREHKSGTDRLTEIANPVDAQIVVNIQGDEPLIHFSMIDELVNYLLENPEIPMATFAHQIKDEKDLQDTNVVKVVKDKNNFALYFSRSQIPHLRSAGEVPGPLTYFKHLGLYAYTKDFLFTFTNLPAGELEKAERLEQLRALEHGYKIKVLETGFDTKEVTIGKVSLSNSRTFALIAGPCVIEEERFCLDCARSLKKITEELDIPFIFKSSYDKANRSALKSYRGPGLKKGLEILGRIKREVNVPLLSDVHCRAEIKQAASVLDVIQVPAFLSRQTDLLTEAARTKKPINIKKGQFLAPWDVKNVIEKIASCGNKNIIITERGTSFGYNNLVSDMRSIAILKQFGYPVIFDASHSVQLPSALGTASGGQREFIATLARAAVAAGCAGLFVEVHPRPDKAPCDGPNMIDFVQLQRLLKQLKQIDKVVKKSKS